MVECGAFVVSALAGGVLAEATSARTTNFVTFAVRSHLALTLRTTVRRREVSRSAGSAASRACRGRAVAPEGGGVRPAGGC
jgi:hypothetical protein